MNCLKGYDEEMAERYVANGLSEAERTSFEEHTFECDPCFESVQALSAVRGALRTAGPGKRSNRPVWIWSGAGIAAAIAIVGFLTVRHPGSVQQTPQEAVTQKAPDPTLLARFDPPAYNPPTYRGIEQASAKQFRDAMVPYRAGDYKSALDGLRKAVTSDPKNLDARYFAGICALLTGDIDAGISDLKFVTAAGDASPYREEAHFYLANALLKQNHPDLARAELAQTIAIHGDLQQKASTLLAALDGR